MIACSWPISFFFYNSVDLRWPPRALALVGANGQTTAIALFHPSHSLYMTRILVLVSLNALLLERGSDQLSDIYSSHCKTATTKTPLNLLKLRPPPPNFKFVLQHISDFHISMNSDNNILLKKTTSIQNWGHNNSETKTRIALHHNRNMLWNV